VNAPRRGRPALPCTRPDKKGAATRHGWRRRRVGLAPIGLRSSPPQEQERLGVARNLSRLIIYVACGPCSGEFEVVSFPVFSLYFSQDSALLLFLLPLLE
jgi:hypothetical protein